MNVTLTTIDPILRAKDICRLLKISSAQFYALKARGFFAEHRLLVEVHPVFDRGVRYHGGPFVEWLSDQRQAILLRQALKELSSIRA